MAFNIEDTTEPEERIPVGHCKRCDDPLYNGDEVVSQDGYICQNCKKAESFKTATTSNFKEFIENHSLDDEFAEWYYPDVTVLGEETEDYE